MSTCQSVPPRKRWRAGNVSTQKKNLLLEIGCEELPVFHQALIREKFANLDERGFSRLKHGRLMLYTTPRRIVICAEDLAGKTDIYKEKVFGPPKNVAFDKEGKFTPAAIGFAKSRDARAEDLKIERNETRGGGEYVCVEKTSGGTDTKAYLKELLPALIRSIGAIFEKTMRWPQEKELSFSRPVRWILALYGKEIVKFRVFGLDSSNITCGNRLAANRKIKIKEAGIEEFKKTLAKAYVMLDQDVREESIMLQTQKAIECEHTDSVDLAHRKLVAEVAGLVEWPRAVTGVFSKEYLDLPAELVKTCMMGHERFFPVEKNEKLEAKFISVLNNPLKSAEKAIRKGNESVLTARLADAKYFYEHDAKEDLNARFERLKNITFQGKMGSMFDKSLRIKEMASAISSLLGVDAQAAAKISRAAELSKIDIGTRVVSEFPSLQGKMGRIYAKASGEDENTAAAIEEQYTDRPAGIAGAVIGIADRIDNICAFFAQGYKATGSEDPYGARRDAQGLIEILMRTTQVGSLPINGLVDRELELVSEKSANKNAKSEIMSFIRQRVQTLFKEESIEYDESDAVMETALNINLRTAVERAKVIQQFREREDFKKFIIAFKRVVNILKQAEVKRVNVSTCQRVNEELLKEKEEKILYEIYLKIKDDVKDKIEKNNFKEAMEKLLANLGKPIDDLFDNVMVMTDDNDLKTNRLAILSAIAGLFFLTADFSKIVLSEQEAVKK